MAYTIFDKPVAPTTGELYGQAIGQGAGSILTVLAQDKLQQMAAQRQQAAEQAQLAPLAKRFGLEGYEGLGKAGLTKALLQKQKQAFELGDANAFNETTSLIDTLTKGEPQQLNAQVTAQKAATASPITETINPPASMVNTKNIPQTVVSETVPAATQKPQRLKLPPFQDIISQQKAAGVIMTPQKQKELHNYYNQQERDAETKYKTDLEDWRETQKIEAAENKAGGKEIKKMYQEYKTADDAINTYKEIGGYLASGNLQTGPGVALLKKFNLEDVFLNPASRGAEAAINGLILEDSKDLKGSLSDKDIRFLTATEPSLSNSPEGLSRLLNIRVLKERFKQVPYNEAREITKKSKTIPSNIDELVEDKSKNNKKAYAHLMYDLAANKKHRTRTDPESGDRFIEYNGSWYEF